MTIPLSRLTDHDILAITSARRGGMRELKPGYIIEEPEVNVKEFGHGGGIGRQKRESMDTHHDEKRRRY